MAAKDKRFIKIHSESMGENQIFALNQDGTQIEGTLKEHYILKKQ